MTFESLEPFLTSSVSPHVKPSGPFCFRSLILAEKTSKVEKRERTGERERETARKRERRRETDSYSTEHTDGSHRGGSGMGNR